MPHLSPIAEVFASPHDPLQSFAVVENTQEVQGQVSRERRHYISTLPAEAERIAGAVRAHWSVENQVH